MGSKKEARGLGRWGQPEEGWGRAMTLLLGASILLCLCSSFGLGVSFPLTWGHPAWLSPSCSFP